MTCRCSSCTRMWLRVKNLTGASGHRQADDEARPEDAAIAVAPVLGRDLAAQGFYDLPADRQPQPGMLPKALAARTFRIKPVEDVFQVGIGDARPLVLDRQFRHAIGLAHPYGDPAAGRAEGLGVA